MADHNPTPPDGRFGAGSPDDPPTFLKSPSHAPSGRASLRQIALATRDLEADTCALQSVFQTGPAFADARVSHFGIRNAVLPLGRGSFIELVTPAETKTAVGRFLAGQTGREYHTMIEVGDLAGVRERAEAMGLRSVFEHTSDGGDGGGSGWSCTHWHPADLGGFFLDTTEVGDPAGAWPYYKGADLDPASTAKAGISASLLSAYYLVANAKKTAFDVGHLLDCHVRRQFLEGMRRQYIVELCDGRELVFEDDSDKTAGEPPFAVEVVCHDGRTCATEELWLAGVMWRLSPAGPPGPYRPYRNADPFEEHVGSWYVNNTTHEPVLAVRDHHCNGMRILHGGCLMSFVDFALFVATREVRDRSPYVTLSLTTNFAGSARAGDFIHANVSVARKTKSFLFLSGTVAVLDDDGCPDPDRVVGSFSAIIKKLPVTALPQEYQDVVEASRKRMQKARL